MQGHVWKMACPGDFVMSGDGRYAANAGAISGHMGCVAMLRLHHHTFYI